MLGRPQARLDFVGGGDAGRALARTRVAGGAGRGGVAVRAGDPRSGAGTLRSPSRPLRAPGPCPSPQWRSVPRGLHSVLPSPFSAGGGDVFSAYTPRVTLLLFFS